MILRDVTVSRDKHRLGVAAAAPSPLAVVADESPRLNLNDVIGWLSKETESSRRACARALASDLDELRAAARKDGFAAGEATAIKQIEARHAAALSRLAAVAAAVEDSNTKAMERLANDCAAIVAEAFAKLAGEHLVTPAASLGAVRAVLNRVRDTRRYTIFVHPADLCAIEAEREAIGLALGMDRLDLQADAALASGGCRIESDLGTLDANFEVQLRTLYETLRAAHNQHKILP